jgi:hypothetical protein
MARIDRPIFILGPARSGTSVLYKTFCTHPEVGFLHHATKRWPEWPRAGECIRRLGLTTSTPKEANQFWNRYKTRRVDIMTAEDATPECSEWYQRIISGVLAAQGKPRFAAKCPPQSVRVPWIDAVFPDALFLVAVRDWRGVVNSTVKKRIRHETHHKDFWGVHLPGHKAMKEMPSEHSAAHIFRVVHEMIEGWQAQWPERFHRVVYAELCEDPRGVLHGVADFCDLSWSDEFEATLPESQPCSNYKWKENLDPTLVAHIRDVEGPTLDRYTEDALRRRETS